MLLQYFKIAFSVASIFCVGAAFAQSAAPYGLPINLESAKKASAAAVAEARKNN